MTGAAETSAGGRVKPVTGPDGNNPITDEHLREMISGNWPPHIRHAASCALYADISPGERLRETERCAAAWNARHGGG